MFELQICEGGTEGNKVWQLLNETARRFFSLPLANIQAACNNRRQLLVNQWRHRDAHSYMSDYGLPDITFKTGISEAEPPFDLFRPIKVEVCIWANKVSRGNQGLAPMEVGIFDGGRHARLHVYLSKFEERCGSFYVREANESLEDILIHELLHVCGDTQHDGIVRHNIIGIMAVKPLLRQG